MKKLLDYQEKKIFPINCAEGRRNHLSLETQKSQSCHFWTGNRRKWSPKCRKSWRRVRQEVDKNVTCFSGFCDFEATCQLLKFYIALRLFSHYKYSFTFMPAFVSYYTILLCDILPRNSAAWSDRPADVYSARRGCYSWEPGCLGQANRTVVPQVSLTSCWD